MSHGRQIPNFWRKLLHPSFTNKTEAARFHVQDFATSHCRTVIAISLVLSE